MLLFPKEEHDQIRAGFKTITFRDWDKLRVEVGKEYKSFGLGFVRIEDIGYLDFKRIPDEDLAAAGFDSLDDFKIIFRKRNPGFNFGSGRLIRIKFTYLGAENKSAGRVKPNDRELIRIMERLIEIDVMSELDIKCDDVLAFLDPEAAKNSLSISKKFAIDRDDTRMRMKQLQQEGLVSSDRTGFKLTVRGKTYCDSKI
ncbi:MAG: hypothetical protein GY841_14280 [FCB group bacterium]|nr:hypothetical protein [FCB group bacterium]